MMLSPAPPAESLGTVAVSGTRWSRFLAFLGPGYLVATGYMDPGNWATSLAAGSKFGSALLFVVVLSSLMAIVLQALSARLGFVTGADLASLCRREYPRPLVIILWLVSETAILATDLAEVVGTAIGLQLLFGLPLWLGAILTALDALLVLALQRFGFRKLEAVVVALLILIALSFAFELSLARPTSAEILSGLIPKTAAVTDPQMLYLSLGILGATIMPHNLFLHSAVVRTRAIAPTREALREAVAFASADSAIALGFALIINAAILLLAAAAFHRNGHTDIAEIGDAYRLLEPLFGAALAAKLFALALIACGVNSTITATLAGQIVMDGFVRLRLPPAARRLLTRSIAIVPAVAVTIVQGESATARLLVLSQVILAFALPFAIGPLMHFSFARRLTGDLRAPLPTLLAGAIISAAIVALNVKLIVDLL
ncbi:MAG: Nramp family divalent metal transporter [Hyphomicrobiales bacterium]|nr:Nramp family divalent metal transporter [Hyphomicrobiales bacterium]